MVENYNAIKYYSNNDMSIGYSLEQAEPVINAYDPAKEYTDINEVIELFNIQQLMDSGVLLTRWDSQTVGKLKATCRLFNEKIGRFFAGINNDNFIDVFKSLNSLYIEDYWFLFSRYRVYSRVEGTTFISLLTQDIAALWPVLEQKAIVDYYDSDLASFMRASDQSAELLMDSFLSSHERKYHFPKALQPTEYELIFEVYTESDHPNPNYLGLLANSQSSGECPISPKLRQKARHRYEEEIQKRFNEQTGFQYGVAVGFDDIEPHVKIESIDKLTPQIIFSTRWIKENLDYPTLLNNFRYLFDQVDGCWRSNLVSLRSQLGVFERTLGLKGKKEYQIGMAYRIHDMMTLGEVRGYRAVLRDNGINLEDIFRWFFEDYLKGEFQAEGFSFQISSEGTSFLEKCRNLASEMDGVLKQYRAYLQDGGIDRELFEMTSEHVVFSELPSFLPNKYAYANSDEIQKEMFLLFSDQSMLHYTEKTKSKYKTISELLRAEEMTLNDFALFQVQPIKWLIDRGSILESDNTLRVNEERVFVLRDLYEHEVICPTYFQRTKSVIEALIRNNDLRYGRTLFSEPEQAYLNYQLNQAEFSNGLDLRNKYIHSSYSRDPRIQEEDYDRLLRIMALVVMKVNEEFCLRDLREQE